MEKRELTGYASIDRPWLKYYSHDAIDMKVPDMSIYQLLEENALKYLNKTALRYFDVPISYKQFIKRINDEARALKAMGIKKDEIVLLSLPNIPESRITIYALNILGAIAYPLNPMLPPKELERIMSDNETKNIFMFEGFYDKYASTLSKGRYLENLVLANGTESVPTILLQLSKMREFFLKTEKKKNYTSPLISKVINFKEFELAKKSIKEKISPYYEKNHVAAIIGTSGTTGIPKGVCLTNENMNAMALQHKYGDMNFEAGDKILDLLIQSIGYGIAVAHYSGILGGESILIPQLETDILPLFDKYKPQHFTGGPIHYEGIVKNIGSRKLPYGKNYVSGGASLDPSVEMKLNGLDSIESVSLEDESKIFVRQGLGSTENGGAATYAKKGAYKFGGVGIPLMLENISIFEPGTDNELTYGEIGEICISGPTVMKEYLNNVDETNKVLKVHSDGRVWLHSADLGKIDEDGQVYIVDRIKNIFMRKGFNVHPSKISDFISSLDVVESSYVMGIAHPTEQMVPVAFVKLNELKDLDKARSVIAKACFENLEESSIPYEIVFVDNMPHNIGGKVDYKYLLEASEIDYCREEKSEVVKLVKVGKIKA